MKSTRATTGILLLILAAFYLPAKAADQIQLNLKKAGAQGELTLRSQMSLPVAATYPEYLIQKSGDMKTWCTVAGPVSGSVGVSDELLHVAVSTPDAHAFYRVVANVKMAPNGVSGGDAVFGYSTAFAQQLQQLGQLPLADFVAMFPTTNQYLSQITFDPSKAEFYNLYNMDPAQWNATNHWFDARSHDFRLNEAEQAVLGTNGFVVSQRLERRSFADVYYDIFADDLPVFVTTDSILHAWHRTMVTLLAEIEETCFRQTLLNLLQSMSGQIPALWAEAQGTAMTNGVRDADYFLAVALSLLTRSENAGHLGQGARVRQTLIQINSLQPAATSLYGELRVIDFSQFTLRGHYDSLPLLQSYFRSMMWCALADFRYFGASMGAGPDSTNSLRELSGAITLDLALRRSGTFTEWLKFNHVLETFVGVPDSLTVGQLDGLLIAAGIHSPTNLATEGALVGFQQQLLSGNLGFQQTTSGYYFSPFSHLQTKLPRSFSLMGQRFVVDSWAFSKTVFDNVLWDENGIPEVSDKVQRRVPSGLDIAFAVLGNDQVVPDIVERISRTGLKFADGRVFWRDGLPYQHNLAAVRRVLDDQEPSAWRKTIYNHWLDCLRQLSKPTTDARYPEAMRTRAWAMKTLNTQLASWTQLRYTTSLYVKESYTPMILCMYPKGYVEPRPEFYNRMSAMVSATKAALGLLPTNANWIFTYPHSKSVSTPPYSTPYVTNFVVRVSGETMQANRLAVMDHFLSTLETLRSLSDKELSRTSFSLENDQFLKHLVEFDYSGRRTYNGWYPKLFYKPGRDYVPDGYPVPESGELSGGDDKGSDFWGAIVTTVHTDAPDEVSGDPGSILHQGVGNTHLMLIAVDSGPGDLAMYGGPVLSHYEFETEPSLRLNDTQWKASITDNTLPPAPPWTKSFLVPK